MRVDRATALANEEQAFRLRQEGWREWRIAEQLGVTQQAVSAMLDRVERRVLERMQEAVLTLKVRQTMQLETMIEDHRRAYEESKKPIAKRRTRNMGGVLQQGQPSNGVIAGGLVEDQVQQRLPDPRYLAEIRQCMAEIRKIWGADAPVKVAPTNPDGTGPYSPDDPLTDEEIDRRLRAYMEARNDGDGTTGGPGGSLSRGDGRQRTGPTGQRDDSTGRPGQTKRSPARLVAGGSGSARRRAS